MRIVRQLTHFFGAPSFSAQVERLQSIITISFNIELLIYSPPPHRASNFSDLCFCFTLTKINLYIGHRNRYLLLHG